MTPEEKEAVKVLAARAACDLVGGCDLCPLYAEERERTRQQGLCQEAITLDKLREALVTLREN